MSDEYIKGWNAAHYGFSFNRSKSDEWQKGYQAYLDADLDDKLEIKDSYNG